MTIPLDRSSFTGYWSVVEDVAPAGPTIIALYEDETEARRHAQHLSDQGRKAEVEVLDFGGCGCGG